MEINEILEQLGLALPLAALIALGVVIKYIVDGINSTFKIEDGNIKRAVMAAVVIGVYLLWYFKDIVFIKEIVIPIITLFGISTGVHAKAVDKERISTNELVDIVNSIEGSNFENFENKGVSDALDDSIDNVSNIDFEGEVNG